MGIKHLNLQCFANICTVGNKTDSLVSVREILKMAKISKICLFSKNKYADK